MSSTSQYERVYPVSDHMHEQRLVFAHGSVNKGRIRYVYIILLFTPRGGEEGTWGLQQLGHLCLFLIDGVFSATSWNLKTKFHTAVLHIECSEAAVWGVYNCYVHEAAYWMTGWVSSIELPSLARCSCGVVLLWSTRFTSADDEGSGVLCCAVTAVTDACAHRYTTNSQSSRLHWLQALADLSNTQYQGFVFLDAMFENHPVEVAWVEDAWCYWLLWTTV